MFSRDGLLAVLALVTVAITVNAFRPTDAETSVEELAPRQTPRINHYLSLPKFSSKPKSGLTLCGLRPGDKLSEVLSGLPEGTQARDLNSMEPGSRRVELTDSDGRRLVLDTKPDSEILDVVLDGSRGPGVSPWTTIERSGKLLAHGMQSYSEASEGVDPLGRHGTSIEEDGLVLKMDHVTPDHWFGVALYSRSALDRRWQRLQPSPNEG